jgi:hypothetical protein
LPGRFDVRFAFGPGLVVYPRFIAEAGLVHRLAVIQDDYVHGAPEEDVTARDGPMFTEELMWRLIDYFQRYVDDGIVTMIPEIRTPRYPSRFMNLLRFLFTKKRPLPDNSSALEEAVAATPELDLEAFRKLFEQQSVADKEPPEVILLRKNGQLELCCVMEFWTRVGGPALYHDAYAYSIFAARDIGAEVRDFVRDAPCADLWNVGTEIVDIAAAGLGPEQ